MKKVSIMRYATGKKFTRWILMLQGITCLLWSGCAEETSVSSATGSVDTLSLRVTMSMPQKESGEDEENLISDFLVMLFTPDSDGRPDKLFKALEGSNVYADGNTCGFDARIGLSSAIRPASLCVVALANGVNRLTEAESLEGKSYREVSASMVAPINGSDISNSTLWGIGNRLFDTSMKSQNIGMTMVRDHARVEVYCADDLEGITFMLKSLYLYRPSTAIALLPLMEKIKGTRAISPTVPTGFGHSATPISVSGEEYLKLNIAEADVLMGGDGNPEDSNKFNRPAIVVGGLYGSSATETYYRLDFKESDADRLTDAMRNHRYVYRITQVQGPGESTPEEAYLASRASISADIAEWDATESDVEFDGTSWLAMPKEVAIGPNAGDESTIRISTNVALPGWTVKWTDVIDFLDYQMPEALGEDGGAEFRIVALTSLPEDMESRDASLWVQVTPRLGVIVHVTQTSEESKSGPGHTSWDDHAIYGTI